MHRPGKSVRYAHCWTSAVVSACLHLQNEQPNPYLVKVENKIQFADVSKEAVQDLDKKVYSLQVCQLIVIGIDADAKEKARVSPVNNLQRTKFNEIGLMFLVSGCDQTVDL